MCPYPCCDQEGPLESGDLLFAQVRGHVVDVLHFVNEVRCVGCLKEEKHEPEVNADAAHKRAEIAAT